MREKIIDAFEKECEKNVNDMTARTICDYIVERLDGQSEKVLKKIVEDKLTIKGAIGKMKEAAKKVAVGNCGVLTDEEGFEIVSKYFGLKKTEEKKPSKVVSVFDLM